jgi:hypothetical protein
MHCTIIDDILSRYQKNRWRFRMWMFGAVAASIGGTGAVATLMPTPQTFAIAASVSSLTILATHWHQSRVLSEKTREMVEVEGGRGIEGVYRRLYARRIADGDEYTADLWRKVKGHFEMGWVNEEGVANMSRVSSSDLDLLSYIIEKDIPALRRRTAPAFTTPSTASPPREQ